MTEHDVLLAESADEADIATLWLLQGGLGALWAAGLAACYLAQWQGHDQAGNIAALWPAGLFIVAATVVGRCYVWWRARRRRARLAAQGRDA